MKIIVCLLILISSHVCAESISRGSEKFNQMVNSALKACQDQETVLERAIFSKRKLKRCGRKIADIYTDILNISQYRILSKREVMDLKSLGEQCSQVCETDEEISSGIDEASKESIILGECNVNKVEIIRLMREKGNTVTCRKSLKEIESYIAKIKVKDFKEDSISHLEGLCVFSKDDCVDSFIKSSGAPRMTDVTACKDEFKTSVEDAKSCNEVERLTTEISEINDELVELKSDKEYKEIIQMFSGVECNINLKTKGFAKRKCGAKSGNDFINCCKTFVRNNISYAKRKIKIIEELTGKLITASGSVNEITTDQRVCLGCSISGQKKSFLVEDRTGLYSKLNEKLSNTSITDISDQSYIERFQKIKKKFCDSILQEVPSANLCIQNVVSVFSLDSKDKGNKDFNIKRALARCVRLYGLGKDDRFKKVVEYIADYSKFIYGLTLKDEVKEKFIENLVLSKELNNGELKIDCTSSYKRLGEVIESISDYTSNKESIDEYKKLVTKKCKSSY